MIQCMCPKDSRAKGSQLLESRKGGMRSRDSQRNEYMFLQNRESGQRNEGFLAASIFLILLCFQRMVQGEGIGNEFGSPKGEERRGRAATRDSPTTETRSRSHVEMVLQ